MEDKEKQWAGVRGKLSSGQLTLLMESKDENEEADSMFDLQEQIAERDQITTFKEGLSTRLGDGGLLQDRY